MIFESNSSLAELKQVLEENKYNTCRTTIGYEDVSVIIVNENEQTIDIDGFLVELNEESLITRGYVKYGYWWSERYVVRDLNGVRVYFEFESKRYNYLTVKVLKIFLEKYKKVKLGIDFWPISGSFFISTEDIKLNKV